MVTVNGYVTLYVAHYFVAIVERLFSIGSWDIFENERLTKTRVDLSVSLSSVWVQKMCPWELEGLTAHI